MFMVIKILYKLSIFRFFSNKNKNLLIIFTRYPEPGNTKTRLIPALGKIGAARLHQKMVEYTLWPAKKLLNTLLISIEIRFTGGHKKLMQDWLGNEIIYQTQGEGNLGDRMTKACQDAFDNNIEKIVIIGTDCPSLDSQILAKAFLELQQYDLVFGPANDGGYYLIGLRRFVADLFVGINWGSAEVLQTSLNIADNLGFQYSLLPALDDIDRPEDLLLDSFKKFNFSINPVNNTPKLSTISIIIPVLNESNNIVKNINQVQLATNIEIIVVDGGSQDNTIELAKSLGVKVLSAQGRGNQMNAGAAIATGDILLFLHADTQLPIGFNEIIYQILSQPNVVAGAFQLHIDAEMIGLRLVEKMVNFRSRFLQLPYSDQAIFLPAAVFRDMGGFPDMPIMEDFVFIRSLQQRGKIAITPKAVLTSGRRWQKLGILKTTFINQLMIFGYYLGVSPDVLARWYRQNK